MTDDSLQTFLDTSLRMDLVALESQRQAIYLHIGEYVSTWAHADSSLGMAAGAWANPSGRAGVQAFFLGQNTSKKIDALNPFFPKEWMEGQTLIRHLREANKYRNTIAHWTLAMSGWDGERMHGWHFSQLTENKALDIDVNAMDAQTLKVRALGNAALLTVGEPYFTEQGQSDLLTFNSTSLARQILHRDC
ncbi:hypothetical protein [Subtercola sp. YIM 133946]|uniref:hypothetical protein n=1 Tax=Subtercola sp. YIM 133946 TaxID=3118909 RepID=UPI002F9444D3